MTSCCAGQALNGYSANTEGGRLRRMMVGCGYTVTAVAKTSPDECLTCVTTPEVQPTITPAESSRMSALLTRCGTGSASGQVTQSRVRELLAIAGRNQQQFGSEGVRIAEVIQNTSACATNPNDPTARFSGFERIPDPFLCPPLPPPPAPPAKACPLTKNQKY
jgi:hypothetical protein